MNQEKKVVRNHDLKVLLSKGEKEKLERKAEELGIKTSQYIRMVSLNAVMKIK